ncbi:MAG: helix-turn-helix domain-containing protein [Mycobacteriales bacterium]
MSEKDQGPDLSIEQASVELGMSPTAVIRLLECGQLPSHLGPDGRRRRIRLADVERHRTERFDLRQQMVQELRARRWAEPETNVDDLPA